MDTELSPQPQQEGRHDKKQIHRIEEHRIALSIYYIVNGYVASGEYSREHWLASFAVCLLLLPPMPCKSAETKTDPGPVIAVNQAQQIKFQRLLIDSSPPATKSQWRTSTAMAARRSSFRTRPDAPLRPLIHSFSVVTIDLMGDQVSYQFMTAKTACTGKLAGLLAVSLVVSLIVCRAGRSARAGAWANFFVSTGDNQFNHDITPLDSRATIDAVFASMATFGGKRVYWRGEQDRVWIDRAVFRAEIPLYYDYWLWARGLNQDVKTNELAVAAAHRNGMQIYYYDGLFEYGAGRCAGLRHASLPG